MRNQSQVFAKVSILLKNIFEHKIDEKHKITKTSHKPCTTSDIIPDINHVIKFDSD
jgi:hypothetical protein